MQGDANGGRGCVVISVNQVVVEGTGSFANLAILSVQVVVRERSNGSDQESGTLEL